MGDIVMDFTKWEKGLPWGKRGREAIREIRTPPHDRLLVKSADLISNVSKILEDYMNNVEGFLIG